MLNFSKLAAGAVLLCATSAQAVELPGWDIARICGTENSAGQCRLFEAEAKRTILGSWAVLPEAYRSACLDEVKEPYASYRTLSQCLEQQALRGRQMIGTATTAPLEAAPAPATTGDDVKIETLEDYFKRRESWGSGKNSSLETKKVRLAALTSVPLAGGFAKVSDAMPPIIYVAESRASSERMEIPPAELEMSLKTLLAERESWGTEPSSRSAAAPEEDAGTPSASAEPEPHTLAEYLARRDAWESGPSAAEVIPAEAGAPASEAEPVTLSEYIARREAWGAGNPAEPIDAPLAAGAVSPLPEAATAPAAAAAPDANEAAVIVHPAEPRPAPQIAEVPRADIDEALSGLLSERQSWGTAPAAPGQQMAARSADATSCEAGLREAVGKGTILFRSGSAVLDAASYPTLDELSVRAKACRNASISIEGHTDNLGSERMNQKLSEERATAVLNYLTRGGVESSRIKAVGFGKSRPLVPNTTDENRAKNRRIEFSVR